MLQPNGANSQARKQPLKKHNHPSQTTPQDNLHLDSMLMACQQQRSQIQVIQDQNIHLSDLIAYWKNFNVNLLRVSSNSKHVSFKLTKIFFVFCYLTLATPGYDGIQTHPRFFCCILLNP